MQLANPMRVLVLVALLAPTPSAAQEANVGPRLWGSLEPGAHAVGYRSWWAFDDARRYAMTLDGGGKYGPAARPVLVNVWFPATRADDAEAMEYAEYFEIESDERGVGAYSSALASYARDVAAEYTVGWVPDSQDAGGRARFDALLATATACVRDAPPAAGTFPLVLYHSGYGSSFEDNSVLCEFLASHGFVVAGSAFPKGDGSSFNIDAFEGSLRDLDVLVRSVASRVPTADAMRVGMAGHSGGAHTTVRYRAEPASVVDAIVLLDTTQDAHGLSDPRWEFPTRALERIDAMSTPMLVTANAEASFVLMDGLVHAERDYLTLDALGHNDFISQGVLLLESTGSDEDARVARYEYDELCRAIRAFFTSALADDAAAFEGVRERWSSTPLGGPDPNLVHVPRGVSVPPVYAPQPGIPPTPRQLRGYLNALDPSEAADRMLALFAAHPDAPIFGPNVSFGLMMESVFAGDSERARELARAYRTIRPTMARSMVTISGWYTTPRRIPFRRAVLEAAELLAPGDEGVAAARDALGD